MTEKVILIRFGEIALKGKNRSMFERSLRKDIRRVLRGLDVGSVDQSFGRVLVRLGKDHEQAQKRLCRVFGIVSVSIADEIDLDLELINSRALLAVEQVRGPGDQSFRISARRGNKSFHLTSQDLNRTVGAHILSQCPGLHVDLFHPDIDVGIDVRDRAYIYSHTRPGPGGLPVGSGGRAVLLLSGGIDSPVAGWLTGKRGVVLDCVHFESFPFTGEGARQKAVDLARLLSLYVGPLRLHLVHFTDIQKALAASCPDDLGTVLMRRQMMRLAGMVAENAGALITGESIGQVASQTIEALACTDAVADRPVIRPVITYDKSEIMDLARKIGSYDISIRPFEDCCTLFVPARPRTRPSLHSVEQAESVLDLPDLLEGARERTRTLELAESWDGPLARSILG